jgi:transcriptional regulator with XRE-family HTH domain
MLHLRLLELRKNKRCTQAEIAEFLRITPQTYSLYEIGKHNINNETLCFLADFYGVSTDYLLGRQEEVPSFLDARERTMVEQYRALDERAKDSIMNSLAYEYSRTPQAKDAKKRAI